MRSRSPLGVAVLVMVLVGAATPAPGQTRPASRPATEAGLRATLPKTFAGQRRAHAYGNTDPNHGRPIPSVNAEYVLGGTAVDHGSIALTDFAADPAALPALRERVGFGHDVTEAEHWVKTVTIKGYTAVESVYTYNQQATVTLIVRDRFVVTFEFIGMSMDQLRPLVEKFDWSAVEALAH